MIYTHLLNGIIAERAYSTYLEIGSGYGSNFNRIVCDTKVGVDSHFHATHYMSSDRFFAEVAPRLMTFDVILVDGNAAKNQRLRDLQSALSSLSPGGIIMCLDVTREGSEAWEEFTRVTPFHAYVVPVGPNSEIGILDTASVVREGILHVAIDHSFELAMGTAYHFLAEVLPNIHCFLHEMGVYTDNGPVVQFYCDTFHDYLGQFTSLPVLSSKYAPANATTITEASRLTTRKNVFWMKQLKNFLLCKWKLSPSAPYDRILLIDRRTSRRLDDQRQVLEDALREKVGAPKGLKVQSVFVEDFSVPRQLALFSKAAAVIAVHGAAEVNLMWMQPGSSIIELGVPTYPVGFYAHLASKFQIQHDWIFPNNLPMEQVSRHEADTLSWRYSVPSVVELTSMAVTNALEMKKV